MCSERLDGMLKRVLVQEGDILSIFSRQLTISLPSLEQTIPLDVESNEDRYGDNAGEMSPGSSTESYPAFAHIGLRENPGKNLNQALKKKEEEEEEDGGDDDDDDFDVYHATIIADGMYGNSPLISRA
ncbi:hypothetical protein ANN_17576 [Periplaneta americana]|uniref:Uncharacterized protein n=1 Tax=Periplaneta americana TaxID=6978 RepID=A0ABQ8SUT2_PERAM|nr:hypothetical protein ANN_17576 [Periplaneta americana]